MNLRYFFKKANKEKWAIGQFNFSALPQLKGIVEAAQDLKSPIILGTSEGESKFIGLETTVALRDALRKKTNLPIFLNLDHGKSEGLIKLACKLGYDMVHFDGSKMKLSENIKQTKKIVKFAKKFGVLVEGEVGILGTESSKIYKEDFKIKEEYLTKPEEAERFVKETGVGCLAVSIGTFHGMKIKGENPRIRLERLKEIRRKTKGVFLVLHGGSGTQAADIKKAIEIGIVKININTEIRRAFTENLRRTLNKNSEEIVPYKYFSPVVQKVQKVVEKKIKLFKSSNKVEKT